MFRKLLITTAFAAIQRLLIDKIKYEPLKAYLQSLITPAQTITDLLTDANPDNVGQLKAFWEQHHVELIKQDIELAKKIVADRVTNADVRELILSMLNGIEVRDTIPLTSGNPEVSNRDLSL